MNKKGFTLIEMLIVVTILGILAAVVLPRFQNTSGDATKKAHATERSFINTQIEGFATQAAVDAVYMALTNAATPNNAAGGFSVSWSNYFPDITAQGSEGTWKCNQGVAWTTASGRAVTSTHSGHE